jgi:hypothetical protein
MGGCERRVSSATGASYWCSTASDGTRRDRRTLGFEVPSCDGRKGKYNIVSGKNSDRTARANAWAAKQHMLRVHTHINSVVNVVLL